MVEYARLILPLQPPSGINGDRALAPHSRPRLARGGWRNGAFLKPGVAGYAAHKISKINSLKTMIQTQFTLQNQHLSLSLDAERGARITGFALAGGANVLADVGPQTGSTFWPSPQSAWGWPPPPTLDAAAYSAAPNGREAIVFTSAECELTRLQVTKRFVLRRSHMEAHYTIRNCDSQSKHWAPWEITRVYGGLTFYSSRTKPLAISTGHAVLQEGTVWHQYQPHGQHANQKVFGNHSGGWLANVHNGLLLVKQFKPIYDLGQVAPGEAEVEIYAHGDTDQAYIEIEQQGEYKALPANASRTWRVDWFLCKLPPEIRCTLGNSDLVRAVEALLGPATAPRELQQSQ